MAREHECERPAALLCGRGQCGRERYRGDLVAVCAGACVADLFGDTAPIQGAANGDGVRTDATAKGTR